MLAKHGGLQFAFTLFKTDNARLHHAGLDFLLNLMDDFPDDIVNYLGKT
eukprot:UN09949